MREKGGPAIFAKIATQKAREYFKDGANTVVFDGLYSWAEHKYLVDEFGEDLITAAIVAPRLLRWKRASARTDQHDRNYTPKLVMARDHAEL